MSPPDPLVSFQPSSGPSPHAVSALSSTLRPQPFTALDVLPACSLTVSLRTPPSPFKVLDLPFYDPSSVCTAEVPLQLRSVSPWSGG
jgi:hypothetical protein